MYSRARSENFLVVISAALLIKLIVFSLAIPFGGDFHPHLTDLEGYQDFRLAYVPLVSNFTSGKMPYRDFQYAYPPFLLYLLTPFASASLPIWTMALLLLAFDLASVLLVYMISLRLMEPRKSLAAAIAFAAAPINLWYNDFLWLNPPPMTFLILLAIYTFLSPRFEASFAALAVATLFKQIAVALFPVFLAALLKRTSRKQVINSAMLYGALCFLGSLPYIIIIPGNYLWSLGIPGIGSSWPSMKFTYYFGSPTSLAIVFGEEAYEPAKPFLWTALLTSLAALCWKTYRTDQISSMGFITNILYALLLFHMFLPRGVYKYYYAAITPVHSMSITNGKTLLFFLGLNLLILAVPRSFTPWLIASTLIMLLTWNLHHARIDRLGVKTKGWSRTFG